MAVQSKFLVPGAVTSACGLIALAIAIRGYGAKVAKEHSRGKSQFIKEKKLTSKKVAVDKTFFNRIYKLLKIIVPGVFTPEVGYASLVAFMLIARTSFDIYIMHITTAIERAIISRSSKDFKYHIARFFFVMLPVSCVNGILKYGQSEMALRFRTRLTNYLYEKYLKNFTYYKVSNLDNRIDNADQLLTQDVERFCNSVSDLYSNITKPLLDICIYVHRLSGTIGFQGPATMLGYLVGSGVLLTWLRQPTGQFTVAEQSLEGNFRFINARLITHSEEIAFYHGKNREKAVLQDAFSRLINLARKSQQFRFSMGSIDNIIAKYFATIVGFYVVSRPFLDLTDTRRQNASHADLMEDYFRSGRMMINLSQAMGRLVLAGRELTRLAGFTSRVTELITVLEDLNNDKYTRTMVRSDDNSKKLVKKSDSEDRKGKVIYQNQIIKFQDVPLITPNGDVLIPSLSFEVKSGMNVIVCGPNGCGKSSLFRILGELWPIFGGMLTKPSKDNLFYIPQRPYLTLGTLLDQVIYPHSESDMKKNGKSEKDLREILALVSLEYLIDRESGWYSVQDWADVLSGGEKQRVAMARLFYHKPQFAILDECTSAVSVDVEGRMYDHCCAENISLFTVSHRKSLWVHHEYVLQFDGRGKYEFRKINHLDEAYGS